MKTYSLALLAAALLAAALLAAPVRAAQPPAAAKHAPKAAKTAKPAAAAAESDGFKDDDERTVYTLGYMMGQNIQVFQLSPAELKSLDAGVNAGAAGKSPAVRLELYRPHVQEMAGKRMAVQAEARKAVGKAYAEKFAAEPGVKPIPGGGWYKIVKDGKGALATSDDTLKVHYRGTFIDGTEFDSSYKRNEPYPVNLRGGVIKCWLDVLAILKPGTKAKIVCPSDVAYGDAGRGGIKPGETLIFDIEFVELINPSDPKK